MLVESPTRAELKALIVKALNLDGITPESIADDAPLFDQGLGLDSVDALELVVAIEKKYKVKISETDTIRDAFRSVATLSDYVASLRSRSTRPAE